MSKRYQQQRAKEAKRYMKVPIRKVARLEHVRQNVFKSPTNTVNQNCPEFVILNKKKTFQKLDRIAFDKIKDFGKQGFCFFLSFLFHLLYGINDLVKK